MDLKTDHIYHIYNQGNNRQRLFLNRGNYIFFLNKIRVHIFPFCDILAWCLMPNHFHLMVYIKETEIRVEPDRRGATLSRTPTHRPQETLSLNKSIGIMLASYTRAINKQENWSGSLFRKRTKAINLNEINGITPSWYISQGITVIDVDIPEKQYPNICFNYILNNPVKHKIVRKKEDWEFSSYRDLLGLRSGNLINKNRIKELGLTLDL